MAVLTAFCACVRACVRAWEQEVAYLDFGDDRVVSLAVHPAQKMCVVTTAGGAAHGCTFTDKELTRGERDTRLAHASPPSALRVRAGLLEVRLLAPRVLDPAASLLGFVGCAA